MDEIKDKTIFGSRLLKKSEKTRKFRKLKEITYQQKAKKNPKKCSYPQ